MTATVAVATSLAVLVPADLVAARPQAGPRPQFDLEGHRGARGLSPENTLAAFAKALQVGVSTLELDAGVTKDGHVVVSHDPVVNPTICRDTAPAFPGDPDFPYAGKAIYSLTLAQLKTLDCGTPTPAVRPSQPVPGTRMPTLAEVFELVARYGARHVGFDIETKLDPRKPEETADPATFAAKVIEVIEAYGVAERSDIQSFDWRTLVEARRIRPGLRLVALAQKPTIFPGTPWTAGVAIEPGAFDGSLASAAKSIGADALSVRAGDITDALIVVTHRRGMRIVPWTVNTVAAIGALIDRGVDGVITDFPDRARQAMAERGMRLPESFAAPLEMEGHRGARTYTAEDPRQAFQHALDRGADTLELRVVA